MPAFRFGAEPARSSGFTFMEGPRPARPDVRFGRGSDAAAAPALGQTPSGHPGAAGTMGGAGGWSINLSNLPPSTLPSWPLVPGGEAAAQSGGIRFGTPPWDFVVPVQPVQPAQSPGGPAQPPTWPVSTWTPVATTATATPQYVCKHQHASQTAATHGPDDALSRLPPPPAGAAPLRCTSRLKTKTLKRSLPSWRRCLRGAETYGRRTARGRRAFT